MCVLCGGGPVREALATSWMEGAAEAERRLVPTLEGVAF